jgi:DNA-binding NarL/FixJ family response regulator
MDRKLSILLVEDDKVACGVFAGYIEDLEDVILAGVTNNSEKAIDYVKDYLPDALILDLELNEGSGHGLQVLQGLKDLRLAFAPYILVTTNNTSAITYDAARGLGADFIMSKHQSGYTERGAVEFLRTMASVIMSRRQKAAETKVIEETFEQKEKRMARRISAELNAIGISPKMAGFQYILDGIWITIRQPGPHLYRALAEKYGKTESSVERAMYNALNKAWNKSDIEELARHYTAKIHSEKGAPTLLEFVYFYANKLRNEY